MVENRGGAGGGQDRSTAGAGKKILLPDGEPTQEETLDKVAEISYIIKEKLFGNEV